MPELRANYIPAVFRKAVVTALFLSAWISVAYAGDNPVCEYRFYSIVGNRLADSGRSASHLSLSGFAGNPVVIDAPGGKALEFRPGQTATGTLNLKPGSYPEIAVSFMLSTPDALWKELSAPDAKRPYILQVGQIDGLKFHFHRREEKTLLIFAAVYAGSGAVYALPELSKSGDRWVSVSVPWLPAAGQWHRVEGRRDAKTGKLQLLIDGKIVAEQDCPAPVCLANAPRKQTNWAATPPVLILGGEAFSGLLGDVKIELPGDAETPPVEAESAAATTGDFLSWLILALGELERHGLDANSDPLLGLRKKLDAAAARFERLNAGEAVPDDSLARLYGDMEKIEAAAISASATVYGLPGGAPSVIGNTPERLDAAVKGFAREFLALQTDWNANRQALKRFGLDSGVCVETDRMKALAGNGERWTPETEQAVSFYRFIGTEHYRDRKSVV